MVCRTMGRLLESSKIGYACAFACRAIAQEAQHVKFAAEMGYPLPACMAESGGARKPQPLSSSERSGPPLDDLEGPSTSSSQSFHDVMSRMSTSEPFMVFGSLFHHPRSRSSSR